MIHLLWQPLERNHKLQVTLWQGLPPGRYPYQDYGEAMCLQHGGCGIWQMNALRSMAYSVLMLNR